MNEKSEKTALFHPQKNSMHPNVEQQNSAVAEANSPEKTIKDILIKRMPEGEIAGNKKSYEIMIKKPKYVPQETTVANSTNDYLKEKMVSETRLPGVVQVQQQRSVIPVTRVPVEKSFPVQRVPITYQKRKVVPLVEPGAKIDIPIIKTEYVPQTYTIVPKFITSIDDPTEKQSASKQQPNVLETVKRREDLNENSLKSLLGMSQIEAKKEPEQPELTAPNYVFKTPEPAAETDTQKPASPAPAIATVFASESPNDIAINDFNLNWYKLESRYKISNHFTYKLNMYLMVEKEVKGQVLKLGYFPEEVCAQLLPHKLTEYLFRRVHEDKENKQN